MPNPVLNIKASPQSTVSVKVEWSDPLGVQEYYTYGIQTSTAGIPVNTTTVSTNSTIITGLEPGTNYGFTITTVAAQGSVSSEEQAFSYTSEFSFSKALSIETATMLIRSTLKIKKDIIKIIGLM